MMMMMMVIGTILTCHSNGSQIVAGRHGTRNLGKSVAGGDLVRVFYCSSVFRGSGDHQFPTSVSI